MSQPPDEEADFSNRFIEIPADDAPNYAHRDALREQILARLKLPHPAAAPIRGWKDILIFGRESMRRPIPRFIAVLTACLAIAAVWLFVPGQQNSALAFNELAKTLVEVKSAKYQTEAEIDGQQKQTSQSYFLAPGKYRNEFSMQTVITDNAAGKMLMLSPATKTATLMNLRGKREDQKTRDYFERLRELLANNQGAPDTKFESLGEQEIDGKQVAGFRLETPAATITLWGDTKTANPQRIETTWSGTPRTTVTMSHFEVNVQLEESLFDLKPPAGYTTPTFEVDATAPGEQDLVLALKFAAQVNGGEFPATIDSAGMQKVLITHLEAGSKERKDKSNEAMQRLMKDAVMLGRGYQFALEDLPESADAHYAGKGVKQGAAETPIFWYKPKGVQQYRVIQADLTIKTQEAAPDADKSQKIRSPKKVKKAEAF